MKKIPVGILGATGMVGQKFVELLTYHPWFEIVALAASDRSIGKTYEMTTGRKMILSPCIPNLPCKIVFSGLDSSVAGEIEEQFARAGYGVISNARNHRMNTHVPLIIPEVNSDHLKLIQYQKWGNGFIVTNPNCSVIGISMALKPLHDQWVIESVNAVTLQALSGAGYPGVPSMDILDNIIPFIEGEEAKIECEPLKIMGNFQLDQVIPADIRLSAQCNRVSVSDGHLACLSIKLKKKATKKDIIESWKNFKSEPQKLQLPSAPNNPIVYCEYEAHPQPKTHRNHQNGMGVAIGRLRECSLFDWKCVILSHNRVRGAAGGAILIAELMLSMNMIG